MAEGEPVEFTVTEPDAQGRVKAERVTGPMGAFVQGRPRMPFDGERSFNSKSGGRSYDSGRSRGRDSSSRDDFWDDDKEKNY